MHAPIALHYGTSLEGTVAVIKHAWAHQRIRDTGIQPFEKLNLSGRGFIQVTARPKGNY